MKDNYANNPDSFHTGKLFRTLRCNVGISQEKAAEKLEFATCTIRRYEAGDTTPDYFTLRRMCEPRTVIEPLDITYIIANGQNAKKGKFRMEPPLPWCARRAHQHKAGGIAVRLVFHDITEIKTNRYVCPSG